ncbi:hypothetical protein ACFQMA_13200 [Halosimplex aquaticum]|uniref:Uncharacterized protein n=1 Tax=Halosimplex aquaticum TaxID=3026162 RepID=A0ABD5Y0C8_9EURY|nr:hypothetical protein [Halosimplex aquaticum]
MADSASATDASDDGASRIRHWVFLDGNRLLITGLVCVCIFVLTRVLVAADLLAVGPRSSVPTAFGSGVTAGVFTLITLTLTVNQLISSQVFGQPDSLRSRYEKGAEFHDSVSDLGTSGPAPVRGAEFIAAIGTALNDHVASLRERREAAGDAADDLGDLADRLDGYADEIERISEDMKPIDVIAMIAGSDYARLRNETLAVADDAALPEDLAADLDAVEELLGHLSVGRQYFKTLALQQELAQLSREIIYISVPTLLVAVYVPLLYRSEGAAVPELTLPWLVSGAFAVVFAPLVLLVVRLLRISTVMRYTVSVAPFAPPDDWPWNE